MQRNRLILLAGAVGLALVVVVVLIVVGGSGDSKGTNAPSTSTGGAPVAKPFLAGVPQHGTVLGSAGAPATLDVYEDPQCPFCREWALNALPATVRDYVVTGRVKLVYRGINIIGPNSKRGLQAIYAAGLQNKLWQTADALYRAQGEENSGWITDAAIRRAARAAGADGDAVLAHASDAAVARELRDAEQQSVSDQVQGTPTFILRRALAPPQQLQLSALDASSFEAALETALQ